MRKYVRFILVNDSCLTENMIQGFERRKTFSRIKAKHKDRRVMMEKFVEKMLGQALRQYGRNVAIDPLSPHEKKPESGSTRETE